MPVHSRRRLAKRCLAGIGALCVVVASGTGCGGGPNRPPAATPEQREVFFGPLPGEGTPVDERVDELLGDILDGCSKEEYRSLMQALTNLGEPAVPHLGAQLTARMDKDSSSVREAYSIDNIAEVLGRIESPLAEPYLVRALDHEVDFVRVKALQSLAPIATGGAVPALARLAADDSPKARETAIRALLRIGTADAQGAALKNLEGLRLGLQLDVLERLAELGNRSILARLEELSTLEDPLLALTIAQCFLDLGQEADGFGPLEEALDSGDPMVRTRALEILVVRREPRAIELYEAVGRDPSTDPALLRIIAIGMRTTGLGDQEILLRLRQRPESAVRTEAYRAIAERDPGFALDLFSSDLASTDDPIERRDLLRAVRHADARRTTEFLLERFESARDADEAKYVLTGLQKRLDPAAVPLFVRVLLQDGREVEAGRRTLSEIAATYLPIFMEDAVVALEAAYATAETDELRRRVLGALGSVPHREVLKSLGRIFERESDRALRLEILNRAREIRRQAAFLRERRSKPLGE